MKIISKFLLLALTSCIPDTNNNALTSQPSVSVQPSVSIQPSVVVAKQPVVQSATGKWYVGFSPNGKCTEYISNLILSAKKSVRMLAYSFTSEDIANALIAAGKKGVDVQIVLDKSDTTGKGTKLQYVSDSNVVKVFVDSKHAIAHNKTLVIDESILETGSFNYTEAAQKSNGENCLFLENTDIAKEYLVNWQLHQSHSVLYDK